MRIYAVFISMLKSLITGLLSFFMKYIFCIYNFEIQNYKIIFVRKIKLMRIITHKAIIQYSDLHQDTRLALDEWYIKAEQSQWNCFADVKQTFNSVDSVGGKRYVFDIRGNSYRVIALILFGPKIVYIRFIGTHSEYNKIKDCSKI